MQSADSNAAPPARIFQFIGGALCLDFCNTVGGHRSIKTKEFLDSYADFISWAKQSAVVNEAQAAELLRKAGRCKDEALAVLKRGIELREAVYRILLDRRDNRQPSQSDIAILNAELARLLPRLQVALNDSCCDWSWTGGGALDFALGPIVRSAAELVTSHEKPHLHQCEGAGCGWIFLDSSKNHSRRWCDMRDCGNRAKVRRHRSKAGAH